ncbi:hypothetical protein evm_003621 [Chilo suppressalis]|nr:hypothetical protein evm_003621 [Chilo suppressalis]
MSEVDKLKRRVIRTVAKMTRQEKKPEQEIWDFLKAETKCDCKLLMEHMRSLTIKKINRLLIAEDKKENIIPKSRMKLTDWLLFDMLLVHEDIDVIGEDLDIEEDLQPLSSLLALVQELQIEGKQGEALAQAWTAATMAYNKDGRKCSPMLLQRRWYQLKRISRLKFFKLWQSCRDNTQKLSTCKDVMPTELQKEVAKRYPHIVTKPFMEWNKLIEWKYVILSDEMEKNIRTKIQQTPSMMNNGDLDFFEPYINTIDLDAADSDKEKDEPCKDSSDERFLQTEVTVKIETVEKIATVNKEPLVKKTYAMRLLESFPNIDNVNFTMDHSVYAPEGNKSLHIEEGNEMMEINTEEVKSQNHMDHMDENNMYQDLTNENIHSCQDDIVPVKSENIDLEKDDEYLDTDWDLKPEKINDTTVMPHIINVIDHVSVTEELVKKSMKDKDSVHSMSVADMSLVSNPSESISIDDESDRSIHDKFKSFLNCQKKSQNTESDGLNVQLIHKNTEISHNDNFRNGNLSLNMAIPVGLTFADDGLEFVDDGIVPNDNEDVIKPIRESDIKAGKNVDLFQEIDSDLNDDCKKEGAIIDFKLLLRPVVYTTRLDQMAVFRNSEIDNVRDINIINCALVESKPIIKEEKEEEVHDDLPQDKSKDSDNEESENATSESDDIPTDMRVRLSSSILQKPRSRSYNSIQLCKNPDFNKRLKQLTVGFLSSTRNRYFLKKLKPLTVDVSKAFESKLIDGTMYLIDSEQSCEGTSIVEVKDDIIWHISSRSRESPEKDRHLRPYTGVRQYRNVNKPMPRVFKQTNFLDQPVTTKSGPEKSNKKNTPYYYFSQWKNKPMSSTQSTITDVDDDVLLTVDSLNKMLNIMKTDTVEESEKLTAGSEGLIMEREVEVKRGLEEDNSRKQKSQDSIEKTSSNNEAELMIGEGDKSINLSPPKVGVFGYCCWVRYKINCPSSNLRHTCPYTCECCCRMESIETKIQRPQIKTTYVRKKSTAPPLHSINSNTSIRLHERKKSEISTQCDPGQPALSESVTNNSQENAQLADETNLFSIITKIDRTKESKSVNEGITYKDLSCNESNDERVKKPRMSLLPTSALTYTNNVLPSRSVINKPTSKPPVPLEPRKKNIIVKKYVQRPQLIEPVPSHSLKKHQSMENLIYPNAIQKSEDETVNPLFLGDNNKLLRECKIPSTLNSWNIKKTVQFQKLNPGITVPEGVHIILQESGQLTYAVDPVANVSPEALTNMPALLAAIQKDLDSTKALNTTSPSHLQTAVNGTSITTISPGNDVKELNSVTSPALIKKPPMIYVEKITVLTEDQND